MSFILDALKKAEADRDPEARASLALAQQDRRRNRLLAYGLVVALIANAVLLLWLFLPEFENGVEQPVETPMLSPPAAAEPAAPPAPVKTQVTRPADPVASVNVEPVPVGSLPGEQRRRFPSLEFSTHIYAEDADLRAVVVNGVRLEEGDRLDNLRLHEITEEGAIFAFENRLVSVSVLDGWN